MAKYSAEQRAAYWKSKYMGTDHYQSPEYDNYRKSSYYKRDEEKARAYVARKKGESRAGGFKTKSKTKVIKKNGVTYVKAWMYRKSVGLVSFFVAPLKDQKNIVSKSTGEVLPWRTAVVEVINKRHMSKSTFSALVHEHDLSVSIPDLRVYISTKKDFVSVIPKKK